MHIKVVFKNITPPIIEMVIARLYELAEGFEEEADCLKVFFLKENFDACLLNEVANSMSIKYELENIAPQNWNQIWESNFEPVLIDDFVYIRAGFHPSMVNIPHEIVITPKMSFGTGHHSTTCLVMQQMRQLDFNQKKVFDFGTGTGILAILAKKLGASKVVATDIDEWSIANAAENFANNYTNHIELLHTGNAEIAAEDSFDIILANINLNILLETIPVLSKQLKKEGAMILSGLLEDDYQPIINIAKKHKLRECEKAFKNGWICLYLSKL